jgi:TonB family protein
MKTACLLLFSVWNAAAQSAPADVQAFIPNLVWLKWVEPTWPDEARSQNLQGMVQLLVTLDYNGLVTAAEPLAGPQIFRQAAVDAVRQWQFQPVIRNGNKVFAMTTATVNFLIPGKISVANMGIDIKETMAATQRTADLARQFPRSAEQVLADLEQSLNGVPAIARRFHIAELAKLAFKAGDLNKASSYAFESLGDKGFDGTHDGNMVLGLVAMKRGDVAAARLYLLEAGKSTGSPVLGSFGPNMTLAKALIDAGERDAVLQYFEECRAFWKMGAKQLDEWSATVRGGGVPNFGANLVY